MQVKHSFMRISPDLRNIDHATSYLPFCAVEISEEEEARRREELYQAIGYSEDEEYVEYPKEVRP